MIRYMGGKSKGGDKIANIINSYAREDKKYYEFFVGGGSIIRRVNGFDKKYAFDINPYLITLYKHIQNSWLPEYEITEDDYKKIKKEKDINSPYTAFCGFCLSFGGKWFDGYWRDKYKKRNAQEEQTKSIIKYRENIKDVIFNQADFFDIKIEKIKNSVIYLDPPYKNTTKYDFKRDFDYNKFQEIIEKLSENNIVLLSEYTNYNNYDVLLEFKKTKSVRGDVSGTAKKSIEKLFLIKRMKGN